MFRNVHGTGLIFKAIHGVFQPFDGFEICTILQETAAWRVVLKRRRESQLIVDRKIAGCPAGNH